MATNWTKICMPQLDHCRCYDDSGSCDYCQALLHGEINANGTLTEYGLSLIEDIEKNV